MSKDQALKEKIISKVWEDQGFKEELLANPKAAVKQSFGIEFPEDVEINALSETSR
ncbi:NHLP leader peptide family natural product precursor, partial [Paenibacillus sp. FSL A5-0031]